MPLYTNYRPSDFSGFIGNEASVQALDQVLSRETDIPHAFLFTGPAGVGKTTLAMIVKNRLGCSDADCYYYNSANTRGIDTVRAIDESSRFSPMGGPVKVYMIEECHQLSQAAGEALLKLLEEPPKHAYFTFTTTEPDKLKPSLKRRCHHADLKEIPTTSMTRFLFDILRQEGLDDFPKAVVQKIVKNSSGSPGRALNLLDTVIDVTDEAMALAAIDSATGDAGVPDIAKLLLSGNAKWADIAKLIKSLSGEPESLRYAFLGYFDKLLLNRPIPGFLPDMMVPLTESVMYSGHPGLHLALFLAWQESVGGGHG